MYYQCVFTEVREVSDWTAWVKSNVTGEGHIETRYQSVCVASVEGSQQIRSRMKTKIRFCPAGSGHCNEDSHGRQGGDVQGNHGYDYNSNRLPTKGEDHVVNMVEKHCKKLGYLRVDDPLFSNRINQKADDNILTEKQMKLARRFVLSAGGRASRNKDGETKPEVYKINPSDHKLVESRRAGLTYSRAFQGYCGCRDMGNLRMCYRCRQNPNPRTSRLTKAGQTGGKRKNNRARNLKNLKNKKKKLGPGKKVSPQKKVGQDNKNTKKQAPKNKPDNNNNKPNAKTNNNKKKPPTATVKRRAELRKLRWRHRTQPSAQAARAQGTSQRGSQTQGTRPKVRKQG